MKPVGEGKNYKLEQFTLVNYIKESSNKVLIEAYDKNTVVINFPTKEDNDSKKNKPLKNAIKNLGNKTYSYENTYSIFVNKNQSAKKLAITLGVELTKLDYNVSVQYNGVTFFIYD